MVEDLLSHLPPVWNRAWPLVVAWLGMVVLALVYANQGRREKHVGELI